MSVLSVLYYSEKMFQDAADSPGHDDMSRMKKCAKQKKFIDCTVPCKSKRQTAAPSVKVTSPVARVSMTPGL